MDGSALVRETSYGSIEGIYSKHTDTLCWLGVPYAAPPLGGWRWRAPARHSGWTGLRPAKKVSEPSIQKGKDGVFGSEDCLYLNIYRPAGAGAQLPILFFIHGGNNQTASGAMLDGEAMAQGLQALVVTVNYRLNSLGWLSLPALKTGDPLEDSGNYGLLDILAALDWVRGNAAVFGGDPENITACGYSSGGRNLLCMLISPLFDGKFARAITFSAGFTTVDPQVGAQTAARAIAPLAVADGKASSPAKAYEWLLTSGADVRDWLYSVSAEHFGALMAGAAIRMSVFPHLFADGTTIPRDGFSVLKENKCSNVPMMCLSGGHEFDYFANQDPLFRNADFSDQTVAEEYRFATKYGGYLFGYINAEQNAEGFSQVKDHAPVYAGRCMWGMNPAVTDEDAAARMGGTHGLDLYLVMGVEREDYGLTQAVWSQRNRPGRKALQQAYFSYIRQFMRTGNPNQEGLPAWKPWSGQGCLMSFDADCTSAVIGMTEQVVKEQEVFEALARDESLPEARKKYLLNHVLNGRFFSGHLDSFVKEKYPEADQTA